MRHFNIIPAVLTISIAFIVLNAQAEIINVPDDFETIQRAINASEDGDTVLVQPGEYVENINFGGRAITVASLILTTGDEAYIDSTIIDGDENGSVVRFDSEEDENSLLTGFTLTRGSGSRDWDGDISGGGIHCRSSSPTLRHLKICDNIAEYGGGIFLQVSSSIVEYVEVHDNAATQSGGGINLSRNGTDPVIRRTVIYRNSAENNGGGVRCWEYTQPVLVNTTIVFNRANRGGGISTNATDYNNVTLVNSIMWGNNPTQIHIGTESMPRDTLTISFSDIGGGRDGVLIPGGARLIWGEGNIDEDPLFVDPDNNDLHLTFDSPCVDTGDPDSPEDPDGTRADMGAFPFFQSASMIEGYVLDALNDEPLENAIVILSNNQISTTDSTGFWRINPEFVGEFNITASMPGYFDSSLVELQIDLDDTLEITFGLLRPIPVLSVDEISAALDSGESVEQPFNARNEGNGLLEWSVDGQLIGESGVDPWILRRSIMAGQIIDDDRLLGAAFVNDRFYITGGGNDVNMVYVLNREGEQVNRFPQFGEHRYGIPDLAYDGELLWGVDDRYFYSFTTDGERINRFRSPFVPTTTVAWDSDRELLWSSGTTTNIIGTNRDGEDIGEINNPRFRIYGLAYWFEDPDGYPLYVFHCPEGDRQVVHKINPDTNDTLFVRELEPEAGGRPRGAFMTNEWDMYGGWIFMDVSDSPDGDRIDVWQLEAKDDWMRVDPVEGVINPGEEQELVLTLNAAGLLPIVYEGELIFSHINVGGETRVPVTLTVDPVGIKDDPEIHLPIEFKITGVYPNPFNSTTRITFELPFATRVSLQVFNLSGREVATLIDSHHRPGIHSVHLTVDNLPSGLYIVRMEASGRAISRKVVLFK